MNRIVYCKKLQREAPGLGRAPLPGEIGQKIYAEISEEAWRMWLNHQTMLINEYRLSLVDSKARHFLIQEMQQFLFGDGSPKPPGFVMESV